MVFNGIPYETVCKMNSDEILEANAALDMKEKRDSEKWSMIMGKAFSKLFKKEK